MSKSNETEYFIGTQKMYIRQVLSQSTQILLAILQPRCSRDLYPDLGILLITEEIIDKAYNALNPPDLDMQGMAYRTVEEV
jgi:hypothetical protein